MNGRRYPFYTSDVGRGRASLLRCTASNTISKASLGAKTVEQMECLKHWLGKGWLNQLSVGLMLEEGEGEAETSCVLVGSWWVLVGVET
jgi:hypothetical protein